MTRKDLEPEVKNAIRICRGTGMIEREVLDFIKDAVEEKLARQEECLSVKRKSYIRELVTRKDRLDDEDFGRFVKKTLWTVTENY